MRVAFQGERGAYSEAAAVAMLGSSVEPVACASFDDVFVQVDSGQVDRGAVPIENSLAGSIHRNYDLLLQHEGLHIVAEHQFRVRHCLIVRPGVTLGDVKRVYSHPQALAQCENYLKRLGLPPVATYDTAGSVKMLVDDQIRDGAAIASRRAADVFGCEVLDEGIEDDPENFTRFLALSREPVIPADPAKTSIVFSMPNEPGALIKALTVFSWRNLDLTKIESRPLKGQRWQYVFYLDFIGRHDEGPGRRALDQLAEVATLLRVLGSYPRSIG